MVYGSDRIKEISCLKRWNYMTLFKIHIHITYTYSICIQIQRLCLYMYEYTFAFVDCSVVYLLQLLYVSYKNCMYLLATNQITLVLKILLYKETTTNSLDMLSKTNMILKYKIYLRFFVNLYDNLIFKILKLRIL